MPIAATPAAATWSSATATRFITNTIDGTVYAKIITPAGSKLPVIKQFPVSQDAFAP